MGAITRSVGAGGANNPADITEIQQLLNKVPAAKGGAAPPFVVFGTCNSATLAAILKFQKMQVPAFADGRVDPGGPTVTKMNALAGPPGPTPAAAAKGSLTDVTRARGIAQTWLTAVEPSITGFIFSVSKGLTYAQAPSLAFIEDAFHKHFKLILNASKKDAAHPNTKVFTPGSDKTFLPVIRANFRAIQGVVLNASKFDLITAATAVADKAPASPPTSRRPAATSRSRPPSTARRAGPTARPRSSSTRRRTSSTAPWAPIPRTSPNGRPTIRRSAASSRPAPAPRSARQATTCRRPRTRSTTPPPMPRLPPTWRAARTSVSATDGRPSSRRSVTFVTPAEGAA